MAYKLEVDNPQFPKGAEFDCDGILVKNGESVTLTKEDEIGFIGRWGNDVKHYYGHGTVAKVTGSSELSKKERDELMPPVSDIPGEEPGASEEGEAETDKKNGGE